jgi:hypothetical protein
MTGCSGEVENNPTCKGGMWGTRGNSKPKTQVQTPNLGYPADTRKGRSSRIVLFLLRTGGGACDTTEPAHDCDGNEPGVIISVVGRGGLLMTDEFMRQAIVDEEHLKLLSLGYMISAATTAFFSMFGLMYMVMGIFLSSVGSHQAGVITSANRTAQSPPALVGWIFAAIGGAIFLFTIGLAAAKLQTAIWLKRRKSRTGCMVVAGISCLGIPYGTALGVLTFMVLGRESVVRLFDAAGQSGSVA